MKTTLEMYALTGTIGGGKTEAAKLAVKNGFSHFSVRKMLEAKLEEMGIEPTLDNLTNLGNDMRRKFGQDILIRTLYEQAEKAGQKAIIESIRSPGEVQFLKERKIQLLAFDSDQRTRYDRIQLRNEPSDRISFEEFKKKEAFQSSGKDDWSQNLTFCIEAADFKFENNGTLEELLDKVGLHLANFEKVSL